MKPDLLDESVLWNFIKGLTDVHVNHIYCTALYNTLYYLFTRFTQIVQIGSTLDKAKLAISDYLLRIFLQPGYTLLTLLIRLPVCLFMVASCYLTIGNQ